MTGTLPRSEGKTFDQPLGMGCSMGHEHFTTCAKEFTSFNFNNWSQANVFSSGFGKLLLRRDDHEDDLQGSV